MVAAGLAVCLAAPAASAQTRPLRWDPAVDLTVTAGGAALGLASELLKGDLAPSRCRWCDVDAMDADVREALVWRDTGLADTTSNVTGFVLMPLASVGLDALAAVHDGVRGNVAEDALIIAEAWVVDENVTQLAKMLLGRERPFVHALPSDRKPLTAQPSDNNLSFFSGHTSGVFALAAASGTVGEMRGYRWTPLVWGVGGAVAATTAYLRIAADKHWLTDVLVGAVVGAGIGFAVPYLFHSAIEDPSRASSAAAVRVAAPPVLPAIAVVW